MSYSSSIQMICNPYFSGLLSFPRAFYGEKIVICLLARQKHLRALNMSVRSRSNWTEREKKGALREKPLKTEERTNNKPPTNDVDHQDLNPGHIGWRRVISP